MIKGKKSIHVCKLLLAVLFACVAIVGNSIISHAKEGAAGSNVEDYFKVPYVSTYYFNPKPTKNDSIQIPLYITDYEQSEYLKNDTTKRMQLIYTLDGSTKTISNIPLGDYTLTIGRLSEGMHYFSVQVLDPTTGLKSHELFNELWVIDPDKEKITEAQTYRMNAQDLATYKINNQNSAVAADCIATRDGLNKLFIEKQAAGYRKIVLLPGTYRISGEQTDTSYDSKQVHYISIPTHFTVDMNRSTFKLDTIENDHHGCIVEMIDAIDSHLINGTLEGDRFERRELGLESDEANKDCKGEGINTLLIKGGRYCSASNLIVKNTTGHAVGSGGMFGPNYTVVSKVTNTAIFDGVEIASDKCSTSSMIDLSKIMAWDEFDGYIFVAHLLGYKGIQGDSPIEYISFYDENEKYIDTVVGYQYRKIKVPTGAKYLRATFLGKIDTTGYDHTITVYTQHLGDYTAYQNIDFYDTRTTALVASCGSNILIEGCTYTRCGCSITPVAVDFEEGGEECQDLYYRNNRVIKNAETTTGTVVDCAGYNHVYENNIGHNIELRTRVMGGVVRNTNDQSSVVNWFIGTDKTGKFGRVYHNDCGYIQFSDARLPAENRSKAVDFKVKDCTIHCGWYSEGIDAVADKVTYENCNIYNFFGSKATLRNCTLQPALELGTDLYFYDCTFKIMDGSGDEVNLNLPYIGNKVFDHCTFEGKTVLHSNGYKIGFGLGTYKDCTFDELKIYLRAEDKMEPTIFENCTIKSAEDDFIYVGAFSRDVNHINIQFKDCDITQTGDKNLIYFYAKPNGDSRILFENGTIHKTEGTLIDFSASDLESVKNQIAVDVIFDNTDMKQDLKMDLGSINPGHVRVEYGEDIQKTNLNITNCWYGVTVKWNAVVNDAAGYEYELYRTETGKGDWKLVAKTRQNSYYDKTVANNGRYTYVVAVSKNGKVISWGNESSCHYMAPPTISSVDNLATGVSIKWSAVAGGAGYYVYRKDGQGGTWHFIGSSMTTSFTDKVDVNPGSVYYYAIKVFAKETDGTKTVSASSPAKNTVYVKNSFISALSNPAAGQMKVTYSKSDQATGYEIMYCPYSTFGAASSKTVTIANGSTLNKTITGLRKGTTCYVKVRAYKTMGGYTFYSPWSTVKSVEIAK